MIEPYYKDNRVTLYHGDSLTVLKDLPSESVNTAVTSPPYWGLRDYGTNGQLGLEPTPDLYLSNMTAVFRQVHRILRSDGTAWVNMGDSYAHNGVCGGRYRESAQSSMGYRVPPGIKPKDLIGIPWKLAFALQADGWYLRSDIIWSKPNPMPESVTDRPTKAHEYVFLLSKSAKYHYDADAIRERSIDPESLNGRRKRNPDKFVGQPMSETRSGFSKLDGQIYEYRNRRSVWTIPTQPYPDAHFATFPRKLIQPMILAGCPPNGTVLDPFVGSGTTCHVAKDLNRKSIGIDLSADYLEMARTRLRQEVLPL